ncbi:type VII secretion integral membrane protein EccD [Mycobacterium sp.]|uniref:type VII secretion integral membrane protein EccD n=1 Tax=Mycobacterium sp. TaxID=1785 RepID=UPI0031D54C8D
MHQVSVTTAQRRLAIRTDTTSLDLVVSAEVPVGSLIPSIIDALAGRGHVDACLSSVTCQLSRSGGDALDASKTLNELGIRDGCTLFLVRPPTAFVPPPCDDAAEAVAAAVAEVQRPRTRRATRLLGVLVSACLASVTAAVLIRTAFAADAHRAGCIGVCWTAALLTLLAAGAAYRVFDEPGAGLTLGLMGAGSAALAGLFAIPGGPGAPNALLAAAAAGTVAAIVRVFARHTVVFTALALLAMACATTAAVRAVVAAPLPAVGAGLAAISLALIEAAAPVSVMLARLSPGPAESPDHLHARAIRAHTWLDSLITAFSASAALGGISAAGEASLSGIGFAGMVGGALVLRARGHQDVGRSVPPIVCGAATLCAALVAAALAYPQHALPIAALSMALSIVALHLGFMPGSTPVFPTGRRSVELVQYFTLATIAPLAFWLCGLYGAARNLNLP